MLLSVIRFKYFKSHLFLPVISPVLAIRKNQCLDSGYNS